MAVTMKAQVKSPDDGMIVAIPSSMESGRVCRLGWAKRVPRRRSRPRSHSLFAFLTSASAHSRPSNYE